MCFPNPNDDFDSARIRRARRLRRDMTPAEKILWRELRGRRFDGFKFRRQQPVGPYFADFFCSALKLIVETDGASHLGKETSDARRTAWLSREGYRVLRIWDSELFEQREGVLNRICAACVPSPLGGEGRDVAKLNPG